MSEASTPEPPATPSKPCPKCGAPIPPEAPQGLCPKCLLQQASFPTETGATTRHSRPNPPDRDELARAFPHLQILELIGQGGMGFVYKARQPKLDRLVALKILAQPLAEQTHFAERFTREGRTLAKLNHPNIVTIHDFGQAGPFFYLLMEYVDGVNLRQAMRAGAVNSAQALAIVPRICEALQYAHNEGVLHRDIKPDNILLDTRGRVKIADFGIAKLMAEAVAENPLTGSGASLGTPHYMAPEQIEKPNAVDHRADIYSLGVVFYEMLTGELPLGRFAAPSEKSGIDPRLDEVVFQTLEKQPDRRPQSADEVKTRVETISAAPQTSSGASENPVTFKMTRCSLTTPELLQRRFGPFFRFLHKGDLRLDAENLTFVPRGNWIVMPLRAITSLSLVEFPAATVAALPWQNTIQGLKLIAVTFTEKGAQHRFLLYPKPGAFIPSTERNRQAEEWFTAIQNAVKARTGRTPPGSEKDREPLQQTEAPGLLNTLLRGVVTASVAILLAMVVASLIYMALQKPPAPLAPLPPKNPKRSIDVTAVAVTNSLQHIALWTTSEAAADEVFVPVVRYDDGPWSQSDVAKKFLEWTTDQSGIHHLGRYDWMVPSGFNSEFQMAAAAAAARARAESGPFPLTIEPTVVFAITNQSGQKFSAGLRLQKIPNSPLPNPVAKITDVHAFVNSQGAPLLKGQGRTEVPQGYRLIARAYKGKEPLVGKVMETGDLDRFEWRPFLTGMGDKELAHFESLEIKPGSLTEVYSLADPEFDFHAYLELVPINGTMINRAPQVAKSPTGPTKTLHLAFDYFGPSPEHDINLKGATDLANDELITTAIRYNDGDWGSPRFGSTWDTEEKLVRLHWPIPENFSIPFDLEPVVTAFFHHAPSIPIQLSKNGPLALFTVTNALHQRITLGIAYSIASSTNAESKLSNLAFRATVGGFDMPCGVLLPPGMALEAESRYADEPLTSVRVTRDMPGFGAMIAWKYPNGFRVFDLENLQHLGRFKSPPFSEAIASGHVNLSTNPIETFAIANPQDKTKIWRGFVKMVPVDLERASRFAAEYPTTATNNNAPNKTEAPPAETLDITLRRRQVEPRRIFMEARGPLTLDRSIVAVVNYPAPETSGNSSQRMPRHIPSPSYPQQFGALGNDPTSVWRKERGATNYESGDLIWDIKETFGLEHDLTPAVDRFFAKQNEKNIRLTADQRNPLFRMTNAFGEVAECALQFMKTEPAVKDPSAGVIVTSLSGFTNASVITADFAVAFPKGFDVQASGAVDGQPATTFLTRDMSRSGAIQCRWLYPEGFLPVQEPVTNQAPARSTTPIPMPGPTYYSLPSLFERLNQRVRAGDARVTPSEPLEIFAITNAENKVFRGFLEIQPNRSAGSTSQNSEGRRGASSSASKENPTTSTPAKIFEFNSVTNASNYVVLRTDAPMPVGQCLTALVEDSAGKSIRAISGLTVLHTRDETNLSSSLMWVDTDAAATNWIDSALQQIKDTVLGRQFKLSDGQTTRLFKFPSNRAGSERFASFRIETKRPANPIPPATLQLRSVFPLSHGFILHFDAEVPDGCRLEALCDPRENGTEGRLESSYIRGNYSYHAIWTFEGMHPQNLTEPLGLTITNQVNELKKTPIQINPGESKTLFTLKAPSKEFRAVLKLATPDER